MTEPLWLTRDVLAARLQALKDDYDVVVDFSGYRVPLLDLRYSTMANQAVLMPDPEVMARSLNHVVRDGGDSDRRILRLISEEVRTYSVRYVDGLPPNSAFVGSGLWLRRSWLSPQGLPPKEVTLIFVIHDG